ASFWKEFAPALKEGVVQDAANRSTLLALLRFASTHESTDEPTVSLAQYVARMKPGQEHIYYVVAENVRAARHSPYIERLTEQGLEVLLLGERIDEWMMGQLEAFEGKRFKDVARGDLALGPLETEADRNRREARSRKARVC
ncbi:heat shock protein 90, partial [mine drainage metagenome]